jgi:succinate dehydrogenase/fumarate reductase flavoprotein subunit
MRKMETGVNRRQLLASAMAATAAAATVARAEATDSRSWDVECDVLVVGSGAAAGTAAVVAAAEGAKVITIEKLPVLGGTTAKSSGLAWIFNNFALRQASVADPKPDALKYAVRMGFPNDYDPASPTLGLDELRYRTVEAFYDHGADAIDRLAELGVIKFRQFRLFNYDKLVVDYADHLPENKVPAGRALDPIGGSQMGGGYSLASQLAQWLDKKGMPILTETRATRIVKDDGGRVIGLEAERQGKPVRIRARKGVIFGTGGYVHNVELCNLHQPAIFATCALPGSTGDFIALAGEAGARMGNLGLAWRGEFVLGEAIESRGVPWGVFMPPADSMILVNKYGRRVVNEKRDYNDRTKVHHAYDPSMEEYPNHLLIMLFDARAMDMFGGAFPIPVKPSEQPYLVAGADWAELARGLDAQLARWSSRTGGVRLSSDFVASLGETVARFNQYARAGHDPEFRRGDFRYDRDWDLLFSPHRPGTKQPSNPYPNPVMHPFADKGPYYAVILAPGALDTAGGPQINADARVLGHDGRPIPGLYAAGNCVSAPTGQGYLGGGGTIGPAMTFGYIAGRNAAKG